jgi:nucleoside-diphosphate kinase
LEQTLLIVKPDAVAKNKIGEILARCENSGLKIVKLTMTHWSIDQAKTFYAIHSSRPFFQDLVTFMSQGTICAAVLEAPNAVEKTRELIGATNPKEAALGTIRKDFAESIDRNAVHGSDSIANAKNEINFFFKQENRQKT